MSFSGLVLIAIQTSSERYARVATVFSAAAGSDVGDGALVLTSRIGIPFYSRQFAVLVLAPGTPAETQLSYDPWSMIGYAPLKPRCSSCAKAQSEPYLHLPCRPLLQSE